MTYKILFYIVFSLGLAGYSFAVGKWQIFPYPQATSVYQYLFHVASSFPTLDWRTTVLDSREAESSGFWHILNPGVRAFDESIVLNNFKLNWQRIDDPRILKTGAASYKDGSIFFVNQDSSEIAEAIGLTSKLTHNGGVKALFELGDDLLAYIAFVDGGCATARLQSLISKRILFQLECLEPDFSDLNGVGGAVLLLDENEFLISTGTPTTSTVDNKINQLAQNDLSYWGKILKVVVRGDIVKVEIYSKGHRNPQGLAKIGGKIFSVEHGPRGGDEINHIVEGGNYGWPLQSLGSEYNLGRIPKAYLSSDHSVKPIFSFVPSIGISFVQQCPEIYASYYAPLGCVAVSSMRGNAIFFVVHDGTKALFTEELNFAVRIRKFFVDSNKLIAITDRKGVIFGELNMLNSL